MTHFLCLLYRKWWRRGRALTRPPAPGNSGHPTTPAIRSSGTPISLQKQFPVVVFFWPNSSGVEISVPNPWPFCSDPGHVPPGTGTTGLGIRIRIMLFSWSFQDAIKSINFLLIIYSRCIYICFQDNKSLISHKTVEIKFSFFLFVWL